jgi:hypothetical protein
MGVLALVPAGVLGVQCHCCSAMTMSPGPIAGIVAFAAVLGLLVHALIGLVFDDRKGGAVVAMMGLAALDVTSWRVDHADTDADAGVLVLECVTADPSCVVKITPGCAIDVGPPGCPVEEGAGVAQAISESPAAGGPFDSQV